MKSVLFTCLHRALWLSIGGLLLTACGGGGVSTSANGGQQPDPVAVDIPIAYIERRLPSWDFEANTFQAIEKVGSLLDPAAFFPGARLLVKDRASALAQAVDITSGLFDYDPASTDIKNGYDVKDLSVSRDGTKLLFALHAPDPNAKDNAKKGVCPCWQIYEYDLITRLTPKPVIESDTVADQGHDISPQYLADTKTIIFSSTRQTRSKAVLLDDGKPQFTAQEESGMKPAFLLHSMKMGGFDLQQLTYNQSHDLQPKLLNDGRIVFTRWDQYGDHDNVSFYTIKSDGTQLERYYGFVSLNPLEPEVEKGFTQPPKNRLIYAQQLPSGALVAINKPDGALLGGKMVQINTPKFVEDNLPISLITDGEKAQSSVSNLPINIDIPSVDTAISLEERPLFTSLHGYYASLSPFYDGTNRLLVSWTQCRLQEVTSKRITACSSKLVGADNQIATGYKEAPLYGIWVFNMTSQTQQPVVLPKEGVMLTGAIALGKRTISGEGGSANEGAPELVKKLHTNGMGLLHIRSVYDMDGKRFDYGTPARFIRLIKPVSIPDQKTRNALDDTTYGKLFKGFDGLREIIGYAPVEPDGSVLVSVPADVAFALEVLDADGKRIGETHKNWLQLRAGEVRECNGCHESTNDTSGHGRNDAQFDKAHALNPIDLDVTRAIALSPSVDIAQESSYQNLTPTAGYLSPASAACSNESSFARCRVIINYEQHIQPLWKQERLSKSGTLASCTSCHTDKDGQGKDQVPAGQLNLLSTPDADKQMLSYTQLIEKHDKQILGSNGTLTTNIPVCKFVGMNANIDDDSSIPACPLFSQATDDSDSQCTNSSGVAVDCSKFFYGTPSTITSPISNNTVTHYVLTLDTLTGNPTPLTDKVAVSARMSRDGARNSGGFFDRFATEGDIHNGLLNPSELKLLVEWLDIGGSYYNNPFDYSVTP